MPTIHLKLTNTNAKSVNLGSIGDLRASRIRISKYSIVSAAQITKYGLFIDFGDFLSITTRDISIVGTHNVYVPINYGLNYTVYDTDIEMNNNFPFFPQKFDVSLFDENHAPFTLGANYEVNIWLDYIPDE